MLQPLYHRQDLEMVRSSGVRVAVQKSERRSTNFAHTAAYDILQMWPNSLFSSSALHSGTHCVVASRKVTPSSDLIYRQIFRESRGVCQRYGRSCGRGVVVDNASDSRLLLVRRCPLRALLELVESSDVSDVRES